jgi:hypothetical protein
MNNSDGTPEIQGTPEANEMLPVARTPPAHLRPTIADRIARPVRTEPMVGGSLEEIESIAQAFWARRLAELNLAHHEHDDSDTQIESQTAGIDLAHMESSEDRLANRTEDARPMGDSKHGSGDMASGGGAVSSDMQGTTDKRG